MAFPFATPKTSKSKSLAGYSEGRIFHPFGSAALGYNWLVCVRVIRGGEVKMNIQLTPMQFPALDSREGGAPRVIDPRTNVSYVLVSETEYETVRELLEDERRLQKIRAVGLRNAIGRMEEDVR